MAENYYEDSGAGTPAPAAPPAESETATIPKSLCPGMKVGDSVTLKIVRELEDEYEVSYPPKTEEEPEESEEMESPPVTPPSGMASMME